MLKTGTTSLQTFLYRNKRLLEEKGIGYYIPQYEGYIPSSNAGFLCWSSMFEARENETQQDKYDKEIALFCEYAKAHDTLILSEEFLSEMGAEIPGYWEIVKQNIEKTVGDNARIDVVIFIRRQDDWVLSRWKQQVRNSFFDDSHKGSNIPDFSEFLNSGKTKNLLDYDAALKRIEKVFGRNRITVCGYGNKDGDSFDTVKTFLAATGITITAAKEEKPLKDNPSISMRAAKALLMLNQMDEASSVLRNKIYRGARTFSSLYPDKQSYYPMSRQERCRLLAEYKSSNERISVEYNNGIPFFSDEFEEFCEWHDNHAQAREDAHTILKLATLSKGTASLLLQEAKKYSKPIEI